MLYLYPVIILLPVTQHRLNAVFEHIEDPEGAIRDISRTLTPGGHTMHRVDLRDHRDFSKPLDFLKPDAPRNGCNLWRSHQYRQVFNQLPLQILNFDVFDTKTITTAECRSLAPEFSCLPHVELSKLRFMIYARKEDTN